MSTIAQPSSVGTLLYSPEWTSRTRNQVINHSADSFRSRSQRRSSIRIVPFTNLPPDCHLGRPRLATRKLANSRDSAKRFLRSVIAFPSSTSNLSTASSTLTEPASEPPAPLRTTLDMSTPDTLRPRRPTEVVGGPISGMVSRPTLAANIRTASHNSTTSGESVSPTHSVHLEPVAKAVHEKPVASGNGVAIFVSLAEPVIYLQGFEQNDMSSRTTSMLRGSLHVQITKPTKIKSISLKFRGRARTEWPEGIPPKKTEYHEEKSIITHGWPFFNAAFESAEKGTGADVVKMAKGPGSAPPALSSSGPSLSTFDHFRKQSTSSPRPFSKGNQDHRKSLQLGPSQSFGKGESGQSVTAKGYRTFNPGDYYYNFELPIDCHLPESINVDLGSVKYDLEVLVERAGAFRANLMGSKAVTMIRAPGESSLEQVEPIAISRNWEDQLHYDIVISGKSFPLGAQIPIAFKLTPLAKVQCHRIRVYITENIEYYCSNKKVHRLEPTRKIQLLEKRAEQMSTSTYAGSTVRVLSGGGVPFDKRAAAAAGTEIPNDRSYNLLGDLDGDHNTGPTEMEMSIQLPSCSDLKAASKAQQLHFDTTYSNIQVHHWIKIVMRLSRSDPDDPSRRRHFEISIDSPFHILSCKATMANTSLPAYSRCGNDSHQGSTVMDCGCPNSQRRSSPTLYPSVLDLSSVSSDASSSNNLSRSLPRPIHLLRNPSFNPPPFDADTIPPPLVTPPPQYDTIVGEGEGLADYFARLADEIGDEDDNGEGNPRRMLLPLTPGGRVNRSMDERRTWVI
ncbi:MAG: hypothetical protein M1814_004204 [Vezdaea aestivalis]|nr:MAG: hypothetical protein M1814_004204 [Vezdaea aestivalis]